MRSWVISSQSTKKTNKFIYRLVLDDSLQCPCVVTACGGRCWGRGGGGSIVFGVSHILTRPSDSSRCRRRHQGVGSVAHRPAHQERLTSRAAKPEDGRRCPRAGNLTAEGQKRVWKLDQGREEDGGEGKERMMEMGREGERSFALG